MKRNSMGRAIKASALSLALALGVTSCSNDYTLSYLYMATSKTLPHGLINAYQVDYQTGYLYTLADSPVDAGGRDTVGLVVTPDNLHLYTANNFDSNVVQFDIGTDGKLYPERTYNITGSLPTAIAIDAAGKFLFVAFTYQNNPPSPGYPNGSELYSPANPGPGGITVFPINADYSLGTPVTVNGANFVPVGRYPTGIATASNAAGNFVYVIEQDSATTANLLGFSENPTTGVLLPLTGTSINPAPGNVGSTGYTIGPNPSGLLVNNVAAGAVPAGNLLYVTHTFLTGNGSALNQNQVTAYSIANGIPAPLGSAVPTDAGPMGMTFDLSGKYLYVVAYAANAIDGFTVAANGLPVRSTVAATVQTGTGPTCATVMGAPSNANPSHAIYLFTSNALSNNVTAEELNPQDGSLEQVQGQPFGGSALPACITSAPALPLR